jgi:oxygen-independent coproporphyrinogen-3 oxidase
LTQVNATGGEGGDECGMTEFMRKYDRPVPRYTSYPTAPHFHAGIGAKVYARWLADTDPAQPISLYLHVPYCRRMCWYCGCHTKIVAGDAPLEAFTESLALEIDLIADHLGDQRILSQVHWGGGTPNILSPVRFQRLSDKIRKRFEVLPGAEIAMEVDPRLLDPAMVHAIAVAGVTRVSLGIQDFDPDVQQAVNRVQPFDLVRRAVDWLRDRGIGALNFDLLYGLPHQTNAGLERSVELAHELGPDRIALFGYAHVPWMKSNQRLLNEHALPNAAARWELNRAAADRLAALGYVAIGFDHYARAGDPIVRVMRAGALRRNFQGYTTDSAAILIGLGPSAIGTLPQGYVQNAVSIREWRRAIEGGVPATIKGIALSDEDCLRRSIIERLMCDFAVDLGREASANGMPGYDFGEPRRRLGLLAQDGLVELDGDEVLVTEMGRPLVRFVAACFDAYLGAGPARHSKAI